VNCFAMTAEDAVRKAGSVGKPLMFTEAKIAGATVADQVGELCFRGLHVCRGYWNNPAATAQSLDSDGWFHTGDLARCDADGFYYIVGRLKDMIISGGVNVYPAEIERELLHHPAIADAAVAGVPDAKWGEIPVAIVVLKEGQKLTAEELLQFLQQRLARFKLPREIEFTHAPLPKTGTGKIVKRSLREAYWQGKSKRVQG